MGHRPSLPPKWAGVASIIDDNWICQTETGTRIQVGIPIKRQSHSSPEMAVERTSREQRRGIANLSMTTVNFAEPEQSQSPEMRSEEGEVSLALFSRASPSIHGSRCEREATFPSNSDFCLPTAHHPSPLQCPNALHEPPNVVIARSASSSSRLRSDRV